MAKYSAKKFIDAIPGTGGNISAIAQKVGCKWHTAKQWITDYPTIAEAYEAENNKVNDKARSNVVKSIVDDANIPDSKWWLMVKDPEFMPKSKQEITGNAEIILKIAGVDMKGL